MKRKFSLTALADIFSMAPLISANLLPKTFPFPPAMHPWIFLMTITWALLIFSGVFTE